MNSQVIDRNARILVLTHINFFDVDKVCSAVVLGKLLAKQYNTEVDIHIPVPIAKSEVFRIVTPEHIKLLDKLDSNYFTLSIGRGDARVTDVRWQEENDKLKLYIYTDSGQINAENYQTSPGVPNYSHIFVLGIKTQEDVKKILGKHEQLLDQATIINIDLRSENSSYANENHIYPDSKSFAETIVKFAEVKDIEITNVEATELIACMYWKTNSLRNKYTTPQSFQTVQRLVASGGVISKAAESIFASLSIVELRAQQEIFKFTKLIDNKIALSQVTTETAKELLKVLPVLPNKNPLFQLKGIQASFVLIPKTDSETLVLCSNLSGHLNLKRLFGVHNYVGETMQAEFILPFNIIESESYITKQTTDELTKLTLIEEEVNQTSVDSIKETVINQEPLQPALEPSQPILKDSEMIGDISPIVGDTIDMFGQMPGLLGNNEDPLPSVSTTNS